MVQRPSSPTSLLWAHQLKREHGYLLERITKLEGTSDVHDSRLDAVANIASAAQSEDVEKLAKRVEAIEDDGVGKRVAKVERDVKERLETVQAETEALVLQIAALEGDSRTKDEERKKASSKEKALLKRLGAVEQSVEDEQKVVKMLEQDLAANDTDELREQLGALMAYRKRDELDARTLAKKVTALEAANKEMMKANESFREEMTKLDSSKPVTSASKFREETTKLATSKPVTSATKPPSRTAAKAVAIPTAKAAVFTSKAPKKAAARPSTKTATKAPERSSAGLASGQRPVVREGPGWIEVERTPSAEQPVQVPLTKRALRQHTQAASQSKAGQSDSGAVNYTQRVTRSQKAVQTAAKPVAKSSVNLSVKLVAGSSALPAAKPAIKSAVKSSAKPRTKPAVKPAPSLILSSPVSSPVSAHVSVGHVRTKSTDTRAQAAAENLFSAVSRKTEEPREPAPKRRRVIVQMDDLSAFGP